MNIRILLIKKNIEQLIARYAMVMEFATIVTEINFAMDAGAEYVTVQVLVVTVEEAAHFLYMKKITKIILSVVPAKEKVSVRHVMVKEKNIIIRQVYLVM